MEMQGNATEIDERNLLQLDALLSHGYGLSPQLVMRSKGLSIEAKALYGYLSSFAGAGDTAFPSTSRILEELDISKNRFYKIRKELVSWGFISIETTATSAGLRTVYTLPQNPIAIKTEIDEIANRRNEIKSSLIDAAEIGKMNRREAILLIAGTNPLKDLKYPVEQHPNYIYLDPGRNKPGQVKNRCLYDEPFNILEYMDEIRTKDDTYAS